MAKSDWSARSRDGSANRFGTWCESRELRGAGRARQTLIRMKEEPEPLGKQADPEPAVLPLHLQCDGCSRLPQEKEKCEQDLQGCEC